MSFQELDDEEFQFFRDDGGFALWVVNLPALLFLLLLFLPVMAVVFAKEVLGGGRGGEDEGGGEDELLCEDLSAELFEVTVEERHNGKDHLVAIEKRGE